MFIVIDIYGKIVIKSMTNKENKPKEILDTMFTGSPGDLGGLSNEKELAQKCPEEYKTENLWSEYAMKYFFNGAHTSNWEWQSENGKERERQIKCFLGLMGSKLKHEDKEAVSGWMLSKMLKKVPDYLPREERRTNLD